MATDRQTPCLYYVCAGLCKRGRKADHAHYFQHCDKYKPRARVRYRNQKKEKLEKMRNDLDFWCYCHVFKAKAYARLSEADRNKYELFKKAYDRRIKKMPVFVAGIIIKNL